VFVTNHVLSGVLIGQVLSRRPLVAFLVGVGSHLVLDTCPHWGCDLDAPGGSERFLAAARSDGLLGLATMAVATWAVRRGTRAATLAGMVGAVLLDLDKPALHFFGLDPFPATIARLHKRAQNESPGGMPNEVVAGVLLAVADTVVGTKNRRPHNRKRPPPLFVHSAAL